MKSLFLILIIFCPFILEAQIITTVPGTTGSVLTQPESISFDIYGNLYIPVTLGTGTAGFSGDGGLATMAQVYQPTSVTTDTIGNVYIADALNNRIRKIVIATGIISTIAGNGTPAFSGDSGLATAAELFAPSSICFDKYGNLYFTDSRNYRIRKINTSGIIYTIAGNGLTGSTGDGGPAILARCEPETNMCIDSFGNIYFGDNGNVTIRKVDTAGIITTIAGDSSGVYTYSIDGVPALGAPMSPECVEISPHGLLVIGDELNNRVREIDSLGIIHTIAGNGVYGYSGDGGLADSAAIAFPDGIAFDHCGNMYISEVGAPCIRKVYFSTSIPTIAVSSALGDTICAGTSVTYSAVATNSSTFYYKWVINGTVVSISGNTYTYTPSNGDSIRCVFSGTGQCSGDPDTVSSNTIHMVVNALAVPTIVLSGATVAPTGGTVTVTATVTGAGSSYNIKWYCNGILFSTTTTPSVTYTVASGTNIITATVMPLGEGCYDTATSSSFTITSNNAGVTNVIAQAIQIYPNPAHDQLSINGTSITNITLCNTIGQELISKDASTDKVSLDISMLPAGIYLVKVTCADGKKIINKIVKQ